MKKYYLKGTDLELPTNGVIVLEVSTLLDAGYIDVETTFDLEDIVKHLAERINISKGNAETFLRTLCTANKKALFTLLLKEAALLLDDKYVGHIKYSDEIWAVTNNTYTPFLMSKLNPSKSEVHDIPFNCIAAFRNKEDAEHALKCLEPIIKYLNGK